MSDTRPNLTPERIMQMAWGYAPPLILEAALRNRVFDVLDKGPLRLADVAAETGGSERGLRMLLDSLVSIDLLRKEDDRYALSPESAAFLVCGKPAYRGGMFRHISKQMLPRWLELSDIVRTGHPPASVNQQETGAAFFQQFVSDLFPMNYPAARALGEALGVPGVSEPYRVLDIAAGSGVWGIAVAQQSPKVKVTAVDWPEVIPVTEEVACRHGVEKQFSYIKGDIADCDLGSGYQLAILGHILHSEGEDRSRKLLRRVFEALAPGGVIAIAEWVPNEERTGPPHALIFGVNMLVHTDHGDVYTFRQMSEWLKEAGFTEPRLLEAPAPSPLVLATRPE